MSRCSIPVLIFLAVTAGARAQQLAPPTLFSTDVIRSFTPADNPITDAKAKLDYRCASRAETLHCK